MNFRFPRAGLILIFLILFTSLYWLIPIPGQVLLAPDNWQEINAWPQVRLDGADLQPGSIASLVVYDTTPWPHVKLVAGDAPGTLDSYQLDSAAGVYQWNWSYTVPNTPGYRLAFYHGCHTGCQAWTTVAAGKAASSPPASVNDAMPTKLGVVFAHPERNWHNRRGWNVELTYAQLVDEAYWGIDDLAARVEAATDKGLLVLVRVDYAEGQSIPPANDYVALDIYLNYVSRLARDTRLKHVYAYIIGSGYNSDGNNAQAPENKVTPEWYARVFIGYRAPVRQQDNVLQTIRKENPAVRVLVGPVTPWRPDQDGALRYSIDVPWLNYFNTLTDAINQTAEAKMSLGIGLTAPDGFAVQAFGRPDAAELRNTERANEPAVALRLPQWGGAQAGFRVYQDWLNIINAHSHTQALPVYITATNTYQPDSGVEPAQNYPAGWLTAAYEVVNAEPQIVALCWFLDLFAHDAQWRYFSLTNPQGLMADAAHEFDALLQSYPEP